MRLAYGLLVSTLLVSGAQAADYLRGTIGQPSGFGQQSQPSYDWSGVYLGGHGSWSAGDMKDGGAGASLANAAFPNIVITPTIGSIIDLPERKVRGPGFGTFVGYNTMWDDVVLGVEAEYNRANVDAQSTMPAIQRQLSTTSSSSLWDTNITSASQTMKLVDYGVVRVRAGAAYGRFLPYVSVGLAAGRVERVQSLTGSVQEYVLLPIVDALGNITGYNRTNYGTATANFQATRRNTAMGYALGAGLDYAVTDNIFLRGKYEYISIGGPQSLSVQMHTAKAGIGAKF
jgi:opacity protein-like surface antigen